MESENKELLSRPSFRSGYLEALESTEDFPSLPEDSEEKKMYTSLKAKLNTLLTEGIFTFTRSPRRGDESIPNASAKGACVRRSPRRGGSWGSEEAEKMRVPLLDMWSEFGAYSLVPPSTLIVRAFTEGNLDVYEWCIEVEHKILLATGSNEEMYFKRPSQENLFIDSPALLSLVKAKSDIYSCVPILVSRGLRKCLASIVFRDEYRDNNAYSVFLKEKDDWKLLGEELMLKLLEKGKLSFSKKIGDFLFYMWKKTSGLDFLNCSDRLHFRIGVHALISTAIQKDIPELLGCCLDSYPEIPEDLLVYFLSLSMVHISQGCVEVLRPKIFGDFSLSTPILRQVRVAISLQPLPGKIPFLEQELERVLFEAMMLGRRDVLACLYIDAAVMGNGTLSDRIEKELPDIHSQVWYILDIPSEEPGSYLSVRARPRAYAGMNNYDLCKFYEEAERKIPKNLTRGVLCRRLLEYYQEKGVLWNTEHPWDTPIRHILSLCDSPRAAKYLLSLKMSPERYSCVLSHVKILGYGKMYQVLRKRSTPLSV